MINKEKFNYDTIVTSKKGIDTTDMDHDKVMMDLDRGNYYVLNEVAGDIWETISEPISIKNIINILMSRYNVNEKQCLDCTIEFLARLKDEELIIVT